MMTDTAKFTLRTDAEILKKFRYVADYNGRSANRELEVLMKKHIAEFEKEHGKIKFSTQIVPITILKIPTKPTTASFVGIYPCHNIFRFRILANFHFSSCPSSSLSPHSISPSPI